MRIFILLALISNCVLFVSCKKYKPAPDAFFMKSANVAVSVTTPTAQGTGSHKITEFFLYVNGMFQGAYPTGNLMPIINKNSNVKLDILPGIKNNGLKSTSIPYPFYDRITFDTLVESGKSIERNFTFTYNPYTKFEFMEDFNSALGYKMVKSPSGSDTTWKFASTADSFEGKSIELGLTGNVDKVAQIQSTTTLSLPKGNTNVYLELNYKSDYEFEVGLTDEITRKTALYINPQSSWNKIYIQLSDAVSSSPTLNYYKLYFRLIKPNEVGAAHVWLDNIKVIYL